MYMPKPYCISRKSVQEAYLRIKADKLPILRIPGIEIKAVAKEMNPILQGWINYYGKFYATKLKDFMCSINAKLANWAIRKYKGIRTSLTSAMKWECRLNRHKPNLFAHWAFGSKPNMELPTGSVRISG